MARIHKKDRVAGRSMEVESHQRVQFVLRVDNSFIHASIYPNSSIGKNLISSSNIDCLKIKDGHAFFIT